MAAAAARMKKSDSGDITDMRRTEWHQSTVKKINGMCENYARLIRRGAPPPPTHLSFISHKGLPP